MSQYLIVTAMGEEEPVLFHEIETPVLCADKESAEDLMKRVLCAQGDGTEPERRDWAVFELTGDGRFRRRSVTFGAGGPVIEDPVTCPKCGHEFDRQ